MKKPIAPSKPVLPKTAATHLSAPQAAKIRAKANRIPGQ